MPKGNDFDGNLAYQDAYGGVGIAGTESKRRSRGIHIAPIAGSLQAKRVFQFVKRLGDVVLAALGLVLLAPVFLGTAIAIKLDSKGPVFFLHQRIGKYGKPFGMYKFRSMMSGADKMIQNFTPAQKAEYEKNFKLDNDFRLTRVGRFIRRTSIDELPQLVNILRGELSLVGPRPIVEKELEKYGAYKPLFLSVKPGLTGYWQVNGRSTTTYDERIQLELHYAKHLSLWLDIQIILKTFIVVLKRQGAK